ncbi:segregation/condensation protein A [Streptomyces sp. NPDC054841]
MPPTDDASTPAPRASRRALGRGPGASGAPPGGRSAGFPPEPREPSAEPAAAPSAPADPPAEAAHDPVVAADLVEPVAADLVEPGGEAHGSHPAADAALGVADPVVEPAGNEGEEPGPMVPAESGSELPGTRPGERAPAGEDDPGPADDGRFKVRLANFEGPFDLLLQLISKHKLDVTEVALSKVTDEFMAYIRAMGPDWDLDQTTEFLVVAATLLDLKAARLLPAAEVEDEADLALLEARDLLFARLLQYRAYKQIAEIFHHRLEEEARRYPRTVGLEDHHAELLPEVVISIGAEGFAKLAVKAMQPKPKPQVYVDHIHAPLVSVREQAAVVVGMLRERGKVSFRELTEGVGDTLTVVARFLALLELYREKAVILDQEDALGELIVTWAGGDATATVTDEFDRAPEPLEKAEEKA